MPRITLPDKTVREYPHPVTAAQIAADLGKRLAREAVGAKVNGKLVDLNTLIKEDASVEIVTPYTREGELNPDALYIIRHSCAHVMAEALQKLYPGTQLVYGPPVENGFYYDIAPPDGKTISSEDFEKIERVMQEIVKADKPFIRYEMSLEEGMKKLKEEGNKYKIDNAERAIASGSETLSFYTTGEPGKDWEDLCQGPHLPSSGKIGAFKLMNVASSYWHGDASSDRLLRIYGTAFPSRKDLKRYLQQLEEAKKRDHRVLGKKLQLFHIDEKVGQGLILWTPRGSVIRRELEEFIRTELVKQKYDFVYTPHIGKLELYKTSGHFPYYQDSQYPPMVHSDFLDEMAREGKSCAELSNLMKKGDIDGYLLKPMNCPHHIRIYASQKHSYRELPIRLAEFGTVYRWEQSGEIGGMTRVRGFTQDDAHIFCTEEQVAQEIQGCLQLVKIIFSTLNFRNYRVRVGLRDPESDKYVGDPKLWEKAEDACRKAAASLNIPFSEEKGEAAFYGPKIDFVVKDVLGREWQLGTIQVDYNLPQRFDLSYIGPDNKPHRPVMIHRAPFGSFERFVGVLTEHFAGAFPTWLAPEQVRVLPLSEKSNSYGYKVLQALESIGIRTTIDDGDDRIQGKIKAASEFKIPYLLVVGPRDAENNAVSVRAHGIKKNLGAIPLETFISTIQREISNRSASSLIVELFQKQM